MNPQLFDVIGIGTRKASQRQAKARNGSCLWVPARFVSQKGERNLIRVWRIKNDLRHATLSGSHQVRWIWEDMGNFIAKFYAWRLWSLVEVLWSEGTS